MKGMVELKRINKSISISKYVDILFATKNDIGNWFGYYNYDVLNYDRTKMLCHRVKNEGKDITSQMQVECGYYDLPSGKWHHIGFSDSYNWPQGTMLQWLPGAGNENKVIYNRSQNNHLVATIHDISTGLDEIIDWPIYGITPDGKYSISLNFERSYWCRAYHYYSVVNKKYDVRVAENDGVFSVDLLNNVIQRIIDINKIIEIDKEPYFDKAKHWIEHIMISPNGKSFCFLHRFTLDEINNYETRLFISSIDGTNIQLVSGWREYSWSHFAWHGDDAFTIYAYKHPPKEQKANDTEGNRHRKREPVQIIKKSLKRMINLLPLSIKRKIRRTKKQIPSYYQYYIRDEEGVFTLSSVFDDPKFQIDGHPSFTIDNEYMITDTYPDSRGIQHLYVYNLSNNKIIEIARIKPIISKKYYLCDLHPKLSQDNDYLAVDAAYHHKHHMILFKINWDRIKTEIGKMSMSNGGK